MNSYNPIIHKVMGAGRKGNHNFINRLGHSNAPIQNHLGHTNDFAKKMSSHFHLVGK